MKLGIVKAVSEYPESDSWHLWLDKPAKDAVVKNQYFMTSADDTDASIMRLISRNDSCSNSFRIGVVL